MKDKNNSAQKSGSKKGDKAEQKKYVTKQKKDKNEESPKKEFSDKKPVEMGAAMWSWLGSWWTDF